MSSPEERPVPFASARGRALLRALGHALRGDSRLGWLYVRRLVELAEQFARNGAGTSVVDKDFPVIPPGDEIRQEQFMC